MSKYYKAEDVISFLNTHCPKDMWEYQIADLPTIEFSEDCIGREYMKSLGYINKGDFNSVETIREWIDNAPSVIPKAKGGEWIPCSERLPEDGVAVLTTTENEEVYIDQVITDPYKERYFQSNTAYDNFQVIAWMPLPKPLKGADDYERAIEQREHDALYEPTYNPEDGSM